MFCTKCGLQAYPEDRFCAGCGASLTRESKTIEKDSQTSREGINKSIIQTKHTIIKFPFKKKSTSKTNKIPKYGVKGWLNFLVVHLIILWPLWILFRTFFTFWYAEERNPTNLNVGYQLYKNSVFATAFIILALSIYAGLKLNKGKNWNAVNFSIGTLWIIGPLEELVIIVILPLIIFGTTIASENVELIIFILIIQFLIASLWTLYLLSSKRVRNTYSRALPSKKIITTESQKIQTELINNFPHTDTVVANQISTQIHDQSALSLKHKSYFLQHWQGELPLSVTFWVNIILLNLFIFSIIYLIPWGEIVNKTPMISSIVVIIMWIIAVPISIWQLTGLWQSSNNYMKKGNSKSIGNFVKFIVVINLLTSMSTFFNTGIPQINTFFNIAIGNDPLGTYQIRILRDASELEISGAIVFGLSKDVEKVLNTHPTIKIIHLNSIGGRVVEARKLRDLISSRKLTTYTSTGCSSACTLVFVGGRKRLIANNAYLAFHQYNLPGLQKPDFNNEYNKDKQDWRNRGISNSFIERAFSVPNNQLWKPSSKELLEAGFITGFPEQNEIALSGLKLQDIENIDGELIKIPQFFSIKSFDPQIFSQIVTKYKIAFQKGKSRVELEHEIRPLIYSVYSKRLPYASNESIMNSIKISLEQMEILYKIDSEICFDFLFTSNRTSQDVTKYFSNEMVQKESEAFAGVIISSAKQFKMRLSEQYVTSLFTDLLDRLKEEYGKDVQLLFNVELRKTNKAKSCQVIYAFYKEILRLPSHEAEDLFRYLFIKAQE